MAIETCDVAGQQCPDCHVSLIQVAHEKTCPNCGWVMDDFSPQLGGFMKGDNNKILPYERNNYILLSCDVGTIAQNFDPKFIHRFHGARYLFHDKAKTYAKSLVHIVKTGRILEMGYDVIDEVRVLFWKKKEGYSYVPYSAAACMWYVIRTRNLPIDFDRLVLAWEFDGFGLRSAWLRNAYKSIFSITKQDHEQHVLVLINQYLSQYAPKYMINASKIYHRFKRVLYKSPYSLAAGICYYVLKRDHVKITQRGLAEFYNISEVSLRSLSNFFQSKLQ